MEQEKKISASMFFVNPGGEQQFLRMDKEQAIIRRALETHRTSGSVANLFNLDMNTYADRDDILANLAMTTPHIFHFAGHGEPQGVHVVGGFMDLDLISEALCGGESSDLKLVFLNACYSSTVARAIVDKMRNVATIGMEEPISDSGALTFCKAFYTLLFNGQSISNAHLIARLLISKEVDIPQLFADNTALVDKPFVQCIHPSVDINKDDFKMIAFTATASNENEWVKIRQHHDKAKGMRKPTFQEIGIDLRIKCSLFDIIVTMATEQPAVAYFKLNSDKKNGGEGGLELYDDENNKETEKYWTSQELFHVFNSLEQKLENTKLLFFNSEFSNNITESITSGTQQKSEFAIISLTGELPQKESEDFATTFFMYLFLGSSLEMSFNMARKVIKDYSSIPKLQLSEKATQTKQFLQEPFLKHIKNLRAPKSDLTPPEPVKASKSLDDNNNKPIDAPPTPVVSPIPTPISSPAPNPLIPPEPTKAKKEEVVLSPDSPLEEVLDHLSSIKGLLALLGNQRYTVLMHVGKLLADHAQTIKNAEQGAVGNGGIVLSSLAQEFDPKLDRTWSVRELEGLLRKLAGTGTIIKELKEKFNFNK